MQNPIIIVKAKAHDMPEIMKLVLELAVFEKEPDAVKTSLNDYVSAFNNGLFSCLLAKVNDQIVGMALFYEIFSTWNGKSLYLEDFIVKNSYRSHGIGQVLFDYLIDEAKYRSCKQLKWQVLDWNIEAIKFYKKQEANIDEGWFNGTIKLD